MTKIPCEDLEVKSIEKKKKGWKDRIVGLPEWLEFSYEFLHAFYQGSHGSFRY